MSEQSRRDQSTPELSPVNSAAEASKVSAFLLGVDCFDDQRFTPGEREQLLALPQRSLQDKHILCWYTELQGEVVSAVIFNENEHRSGGYRLEYFGVHRTYRRRRLGQRLIEAMLQYCVAHNGRYIETFTCDLPAYGGARKLFERYGFVLLCHLPDYYYPGEGKLLYMKRI